MTSPRFWDTLPLEDMSPAQWESLCDGCGKCCLHKIQDEDGTIHYTSVACRLLDLQSCRCSKYAQRRRFVPDCVQLTAEGARSLPWLPSSCAYRLLAEGKPLPEWHPLITGSDDSVHDAGQSVRGRVLPERKARHLQRYVVDWPK